MIRDSIKIVEELNSRFYYLSDVEIQMLKEHKTLLIVGNRIRLAREAIGASQQDLADFIGISRQMVSRIENGEVGSINRANFHKIFKYLRCTKDYLFGRVGEDDLIIHDYCDYPNEDGTSTRKQLVELASFIDGKSADDLYEDIKKENLIEADILSIYLKIAKYPDAIKYDAINTIRSFLEICDKLCKK